MKEPEGKTPTESREAPTEGKGAQDGKEGAPMLSPLEAKEDSPTSIEMKEDSPYSSKPGSYFYRKEFIV